MRCRDAGVAAVAGTVAVYFLVGRSWQLQWGSIAQESGGPLPGDGLIADADLTATRAISIRTPASRVWPWVVQVGQGRGGFYSYDFLENLVGCDIHSAQRIASEWQNVEVGDKVRLAPQVSLRVAAVDPERSLVLRGGIPMGSTAPPYDFTWAFVLKDAPDRTSRLIVRERYAYTRPWARLLVEPVEVVSFVMSQKMLRGIRDRAENTPGLPGPPAVSTE
jgi:hypothetical protein